MLLAPSLRPGIRLARGRLPSGEFAAVVAAMAAWLGLMAAAGVAGLWKLLVISAFSGGSMIAGIGLGLLRHASDRALNWAMGISAGLMLTSSSAFLLPTAIARGYPQLGGFGVAAGLTSGYALRRVADRVHSPRASLDDVVLRLVLHTFSAGIVIGVIYSALPGVGLLLGMTIVAHKGPAGYAAARRMRVAGRSVVPLLIPAGGVGIPAIALGLAGITLSGQANAVVFGIAAGVFLDIAVGFLPAREAGPGAVASVVAGGAIVAAAWLMIA